MPPLLRCTGSLSLILKRVPYRSRGWSPTGLVGTEFGNSQIPNVRPQKGSRQQTANSAVYQGCVERRGRLLYGTGGIAGRL